MRLPTAAILLTLLLTPLASRAQEQSAAAPADIERMVREGMTEALEAKLGAGRSADEKHWLAQAHANRARLARDSAQRQQAFEEAGQRFEEWIASLADAASDGQLADVVRLAAARVEYAGLILSGPAAGELDQYEITGGRRGDRELLLKLLGRAGELYDLADKAVAPLVAQATLPEEDLLAAGVYDTLMQTRLDLKFNRGWTRYYLGVLAGVEPPARGRELLTAAERDFQDLIDGDEIGTMRAACYLARGMACRALGRLAEAEQSLREAAAPGSPPAVMAQARCELARCQILSSRFDEARTTLRPLTSAAAANLPEGKRPPTFFTNLACVRDAESYLIEAQVLEAEARGSAAREPMLQKARRQHDAGLMWFRRLAARGGPWPALVRVYVTSSIDLEAPPERLSPVELLYAAGELIEQQRYEQALERLRAAAARPGVDKDLTGDILFELGRCHYLDKNDRAAAEAFSKLATRFRGHDKAVQAAGFALALWQRIAEQSESPGDFVRLAETARNLLESFAKHPRRADAAWLLPVALERAGKYADAAAMYGRVPASSEHWEEAQFRRAMCARSAAQAARGKISSDSYRTGCRSAAASLLRYADESRVRAQAAGDVGAVSAWSAKAQLAAGELLAAPGVDDFRQALATIEDFEHRHPDRELVGRVLALRIRCYRRLRDFEQAARILAEFLRSATPEQIGPTLAGLAAGMRAEVERLLDAGQEEASRTLAMDSVETFVELERWVRADRQRSRSLRAVQAGRARMHYLAGQYAQALRIVDLLLKENPNSGNWQHLRALVLTAQLGDEASRELLTQAREAWTVLLADPTLGRRATHEYWEARYNWLNLTLRLGEAAVVERAITQERVWRPDLGGPPWKERLEELLRAARTAMGKPAETGPASSPRDHSAGTPGPVDSVDQLASAGLRGPVLRLSGPTRSREGWCPGSSRGLCQDSAPCPRASGLLDQPVVDVLPVLAARRVGLPLSCPGRNV